jgi:general secretion pathway protein J
VSPSKTDGFSLLEAVAAVALTATIILALSTVTGLWLPNWRRGFVDLQRADLVGLGLERLLADLSVAEYVTPWGDAPGPLFEGDPSSVVFVRSAIGPNSRPQLEVVRIAEISDDRGPALVRSHSKFAPIARGRPAEPIAFADPVALIRAPFRIVFAYAGPEHVWAERWKNEERLPEDIRVTILDASHRALAASTVVRLKITAPGVPKLEAQAAAAGAAPPATGQAPPSPDQSKP